MAGKPGSEKPARPNRPHSPEARAGSPGAAAPPDLRRRRRRLQRPRQERIMRLRSWPGRSGPRGSARSRRADRREVDAAHTREPRALRGERSGATPGSEPHKVSSAALAQFRPPPLAARGAREAVYRDLLARLPLERSLVRTDCSLRKAGSSHKLPSPK